MGILDRLEEEFVDVSTSRATLKELLELAVGSILFVLLAGGLAYYLLGRTVALAVVVVLALVFAITIVSQTYWALTGRSDYRE
ncbi:hypothetical protein [Natronobacterium texcoconense]|uniref:Uncharacterized protein n=1 Tax=Natronobacterium texcoconense TaxID=1095778 RepID=A0A1H1C6F7_NATTX|nr:hypothetical protein [Natronobacterium texcoconense]SDQ59807.1 hypothetical protein SAMN04489842_1290 [Natronobacterium texcoconense]